MTAIYVAARFDKREQLLAEVVRPLLAAGHTVTSRWLFADPAEQVLGEKDLANNLSAGVVPGAGCLEDIKRANAVVVFTNAPSSTGGYHVELGFALGIGRQIVVVGPAQNVFYTLPSIRRYATVAEFLGSMGVRPKDRS